jgi:uncharacterized protein (TIGR03083 family)
VRTEERWTWLAAGRRDLADLLETLTPEQWEQPSLCAEWRVRDVAAHVAMTPTEPTLGRIVTGMVRARGHLWDFGRDVAIAYAARPTDEIVAVLRRDAEARTMPALTNAENLLMDVCVHTQDIAVPLGIPHPVPTPAGVAGFERVWTMGWPFWARRRLRGLRLVATDAPVDVGAGAAVEGPLAALLLLVTGRTEAAARRLTGPGVA